MVPRNQRQEQILPGNGENSDALIRKRIKYLSAYYMTTEHLPCLELSQVLEFTKEMILIE